jgi:hypothetical protein
VTSALNVASVLSASGAVLKPVRWFAICRLSIFVRVRIRYGVLIGGILADIRWITESKSIGLFQVKGTGI